MKTKHIHDIKWGSAYIVIALLMSMVTSTTIVTHPGNTAIATGIGGCLGALGAAVFYGLVGGVGIATGGSAFGVLAVGQILFGAAGGALVGAVFRKSPTQEIVTVHVFSSWIYVPLFGCGLWLLAKGIFGTFSELKTTN